MQSSLFKFFGIRHTEASENSATAENEKKSPWSKFDDLPLEEKRQLYRCGTNFVTLKDIPSWTEYRKDNFYAIYGRKGKTPEKPSFAVNELLNEKVSLWQGDITSLEIDAIVNAANNSLLGGGGVDGCIHRAAGSTLRKECAALNGCSTGDAKITSGHKLPAKYVIHTVGPFGKQEKPLRSCYKRCLGLVKKYGLRTVAFCCVSTGIYGYPIYDASCVALNTVRKWLEDGEKDGKKNAELVDRIIFCVFLGEDLEVYQRLLPRFFPSEDKYDQESEQEQEKDTDETETDSKEDERAENKPREDRKDKHYSKGNGKDDVKKEEEAKGKEVGAETTAEDSSENDRKNKHGLSGNEKEEVKKREEAKEKEDGGETRAEESSENDRKDKHSLSGNEKEEVKKREEAKEEKTGDVEMREESIKERVPDQPKLEKFRDSQEDITEVEPEKVVNQHVTSEGQDTTEEKKLCDKQSLSENEKEEVKKGEEAKEEKIRGYFPVPSRNIRQHEARQLSPHKVPAKSKSHIRQHEANLERQLRETQQREENSQRQLSEMQQNSQRQLREMQQREENLRRQLRDKDQEVSELELSLSSAQQTISEQQQQETYDWVISRDEIQMTNKCLGWGAWGSVYEGVYCGCTVAVKQIHDLILSPDTIRRFEREINIASKCRHPHLLQFIGATKDEGNPLLVTELMEKSLRALLDQRQLDETEIRVISLDVARAINYLHQKKPEPIIHRDVSSANVLLWRQGDQWRGKVSDYGTANFMQQTMTVGPGAPIYSAPEALTSNQTVKVDVYSFGVLLCHMCIRQQPDPSRRELQVVLMSNRALRGLVRRCLQTDPEARPTMQEIINELSRTV